MSKILVTQSSMPPMEEYMEEIKDLWQTHWITNMGTKYEILENELKKYLDVPNISLLVNGHMALELTIQAMELQGEVITTPFTFVSTTHAIVRNGLKPVFCDVREEDFTMDPEKIEKLITKDTSAIVPVHVYGQPCCVEQIAEIADKYNLKVIYDAAHAFGVTYKGKGIGTFGDAAMFSFHATKVFNTIEGGAVSYKDKQIGEKLYRLRNFGILDEVTVDDIGTNAKMNEFQAAMGICNLRHIKSEIKKRKMIYLRYAENLKGITGIRFLKHKENIVYNYAYFPVIIEKDKLGFDRNMVEAELNKQDIFPRRYFYPITSSFRCYSGKYSIEDTPIAYKLSKQILTLPMYADLKPDSVDKICTIIKNML